MVRQDAARHGLDGDGQERLFAPVPVGRGCSTACYLLDHAGGAAGRGSCTDRAADLVGGGWLFGLEACPPERVPRASPHWHARAAAAGRLEGVAQCAGGQPVPWAAAARRPAPIGPWLPALRRGDPAGGSGWRGGVDRKSIV